MNKVRPYIDEVARAACLLAMLLLTFGHLQIVQVAFASDLSPQVVGLADGGVICGTPGTPGNHGGDHAPCQACRIGASAALPLPSSIIEPAYAGCVPVTYVHATDIASAQRAPHGHEPRAPPVPEPLTI